jgi:N-acyl-D-aspartate/D-glutamate deacylase
MGAMHGYWVIMCAKAPDQAGSAFRKMTSLPAQKFQIEGHGILKPGMFTDIAIFAAGKVKDESTFERPHGIFDWL